MEHRGEGEAHEHDARLAEHYERAHVWSKALEYLVLAGERSQALFAMRDALHWLDRAVALARRTRSRRTRLSASRSTSGAARRARRRGKPKARWPTYAASIDAARVGRRPRKRRATR